MRDPMGGLSAEVHIWNASLERSPAEVEGFLRLLSPEEVHRARRLMFDDKRRRFIVARGCLRSILSHYLDLPPADIGIRSAEHGKPLLEAKHASVTPLHFNLSHSGELALVAVTGVGETGVDIEEIRPAFPVDQVARHFFSAGEVLCLGSLDPEERTAAFFRCWTRKEAFIKAHGMGLSLPLDQFDVSLAPGDPPALLRTAWDPREVSNWSLREVRTQPGFAASVAVRGHGYRLQCRQL
jgi:4'-phosphopantetheinyl transferase